MATTDNDNAAARRDRRLRLLLRVMETEDSQGQVHPYRLLRDLDGPQREELRSALLDLEGVPGGPWLTPVPEGDRGIVAEDPTTVAPGGRQALAALEQRRSQDAAGRSVACRRAIVAWLYDVDDSGENHGDWEDFTAEHGNEWCLLPFPERVIDRASQWLNEHLFITGTPVAETDRLMTPSITSRGVSWHEEGAPMTDTTSTAGSTTTFHVTSGDNSPIALNNLSPNSPIAQTVNPSPEQRTDLIESLEGLLDALPACRLSPQADEEARSAAGELRDLVASGEVDTERAQSLFDRVKEALMSGGARQVGALLVSGLLQSLTVILGLPPAS